MKTKVILTLIGVLVIVSLVLAACGTGPTEAQVAADRCLRGNKAACKFHKELVEFEQAKEDLAKAREEYDNSLVTPTP